MRAHSLVLLAAVAAAVLAPVSGSAQTGRGGGQQQPQGGGGGQPGQDTQRRERTRQEFEGGPQAILPGTRNLGPCPYVKVLYDAARYVELQGNRQSIDAVGFTGEIQGIDAECTYVNPGDPIRVRMRVNFALGRGPQARGDGATYNWWIAVTERNRQVITREEFALPVTFEGRDRTGMAVEVGEIVLPRGSETVSGSNYEILVGFQVTPEMVEFNREGRRFRMGVTPTASAAPPAR
jgi:hypothetical protein